MTDSVDSLLCCELLPTQQNKHIVNYKSNPLVPQSMTPASAVVELDGEPFVTEAAALLAYGDRNETREVSDDGTEVTVEGRADDGTLLTLTYALSQVIVAVAEYDDSESATATTSPASVERIAAYGGDEATPDAIDLDGEPFDVDSGHARELWNRAGVVSFEEDYAVATGVLDDADPVPNEVDAYWVLTLAETADGDELYRHPNYKEGE